MIFCKQCGNKLNAGAKFCGKCGAAVSPGQVTGQGEKKSVPAVCRKCGTQLNEGEMFCPNCGAKASAVPQYQHTQAPTIAPTVNVAPAQTQQQDLDQVLLEGPLTLTSVNPMIDMKVTLYRNRLELIEIDTNDNPKAGGVAIVIPIQEIISVDVLFIGKLSINTNYGKYEFDHGLIGRKTMQIWRDAINNLRNGTL